MPTVRKKMAVNKTRAIYWVRHVRQNPLLLYVDLLPSDANNGRTALLPGWQLPSPEEFVGGSSSIYTTTYEYLLVVFYVGITFQHLLSRHQHGMGLKYRDLVEGNQSSAKDHVARLSQIRLVIMLKNVKTHNKSNDGDDGVLSCAATKHEKRKGILKSSLSCLARASWTVLEKSGVVLIWFPLRHCSSRTNNTVIEEYCLLS